MATKWTDDATTMLKKMHKDGARDDAIAKALTELIGAVVSMGAVKSRRNRLGLRSKLRDCKANPLPTTVEGLDAHGRAAALKGQVHLLLGEKRRLAKRVGELQDMRDLFAATIVPLRQQRDAYKPAKGKRDATPYPVCLNLGDWHIGEVISKAESSDWGDYNFKIATQRIYRLAEKFLQWVVIQRHGYRIDELHINIVGDLVAGGIHFELLVTNEFPCPVAMIKAGYLLSQLIGALAPHFTRIYVHYAGRDNHGRQTKKPQYKQAAMNNANYVVQAFCKERLRDTKNVEIDYLLSSPGTVQIAGSNVLLMHGDQIKSQMGIPFYGIERMKGREATKANIRKQFMSYIFCGHFHTYAHLPNVIMNGCLCGTNEMDATLGRISPPSQVCFMWHPDYGPFNVTNWNLVKP